MVEEAAKIVCRAQVMASAPLLLPPFDHLVSKTELHFPLDDDCEA